MKKYIVMTASQHINFPRRIAKAALVLIETDELPEGRTVPAMISERARGVVEITELHEKLNVGKTGRCAFSRCVAELEQRASELNSIAHIINLLDD